MQCEAEVSYGSTFCPFCGTDAFAQVEGSEENKEQSQLFTQQSLSDSLASLYKPPYLARNHEGLGVPSDVEPEAEPIKEEKKKDLSFFAKNPFQKTKEEQAAPIYQEKPVHAAPAPKAEEKEKGGMWPLLFLGIGAQLFTLGLLLFFFSNQGAVHLTWKTQYWFVYCLIGGPLLYFGSRLLRSLPLFSKHS